MILAQDELSDHYIDTAFRSFFVIKMATGLHVLSQGHNEELDFLLPSSLPFWITRVFITNCVIVFLGFIPMKHTILCRYLLCISFTWHDNMMTFKTYTIAHFTKPKFCFLCFPIAITKFLLFKQEHYVIEMFWEVLKSFSLENQKKFLKWVI